LPAEVFPQAGARVSVRWCVGVTQPGADTPRDAGAGVTISACRQRARCCCSARLCSINARVHTRVQTQVRLMEN